MSPTNMSPRKRHGSTAKALYAMSMKRRNGRAAVAPAWTPWIVPRGVPKSLVRVLDCQGPQGRVYENPSAWVASCSSSPTPTPAPTIGWTS